MAVNTQLDVSLSSLIGLAFGGVLLYGLYRVYKGTAGALSGLNPVSSLSDALNNLGSSVNGAWNASTPDIPGVNWTWTNATGVSRTTSYGTGTADILNNGSLVATSGTGGVAGAVPETNKTIGLGL